MHCHTAARGFDYQRYAQGAAPGYPRAARVLPARLRAYAGEISRQIHRRLRFARSLSSHERRITRSAGTP
jgi:hypothetical protein